MKLNISKWPWWRARSVTGKGIPGIIPSLFAVGLVSVVFLTLKARVEGDPAASDARQRAAEKQKFPVKHGDALEAAKHFRPQAETEVKPTAYETSEIAGGPADVGTPKPSPEPKYSSRNADAILAVLEGAPEVQDRKETEERATGGEDLRSTIEGLIAKPPSTTTRRRVPVPLARQGGSSATTGLSVVVYQAPAEQPPPQLPQPSGYDTGHFLPLGTRIPVYFMENVESNATDGLIEVAVAQNVYFNHKLQLRFGTRVFVTGGQNVVRDRLHFNAGTILYPNGEEGRLSGVVMGEDETIGVRAYYNPAVVAKVLPYVNSFAAGLVAALQEREANVSIQGSGLKMSAALSDVALREASRAITDAGDGAEQQVNQRYQDYFFIPKGTLAYIKLTSSTDLTIRQRGIGVRVRQEHPVTAQLGNP